jgi:hypothetical protein
LTHNGSADALVKRKDVRHIGAGGGGHQVDAGSDRYRALERIITWRSVGDADLANCGMDAVAAMNDSVIFPRNAVSRLFRYYCTAGDDSEADHFADVILESMSGDSHASLWYGRDFKRILARLERAGRDARAQMLLERYLCGLGVLTQREGSFHIGRFGQGNSSHSWPVLFLDTYLKSLARQGDSETAVRLIGESLSGSSLLDDAVLLLRRRLAAIEKKVVPRRFQTMVVERSRVDPRHLSQPTIELAALSLLREELDLEGVVAGVDLWRLLPAVLAGSLGLEELSQACLEDSGVEAPPTFYECLLTNATAFEQMVHAPAGVTSGQIGYPDLILYDAGTLSRLLLVEVKGVNDRLQAHQEAVLNRLVELGFQCRVLKFV